VASRRGYLRAALPAVYQREGFGLRFVGGLETVLDPIVCMLDALPAHFTPDLAPEDALELVASWLGVELDGSWSEAQRRRVVRAAPELARRRGTLRGLELALRLQFPDISLRIEDAGGVRAYRDGPPQPGESTPGFVVYCEQPTSTDMLEAITEAMERFKPVNVPSKLRVRAV
jgi:phage tail-like protein